MKISTKGLYSLKIMADIALNSNDRVVSIAELSERNNISEKYLEQLIRLLAKNNLLTSFRGSQGGYKLSRPATQITIGEIMIATEGKLESVSCLSGNEKCNSADICLTVNVWAKLDKIVNDFFNSTTLDDVINKKI